MKKKILIKLAKNLIASFIMVLGISFIAHVIKEAMTEKAGIVGQICYKGGLGDSLLLEGVVIESGSCGASGFLKVFPKEGRILRIKKTGWVGRGVAYLQYGIRQEDGGDIRWGKKIFIRFGTDNIARVFLKGPDSNSGTFQEVDISEALLK